LPPRSGGGGYPCPFCKAPGGGGKDHDCSELAKRCWECAEPLGVVEALAALSGKRVLRAHQCAPVDFDTPGAHRVRAVALYDACLATVMAHIKFR
jgi:hypothetical protein